MDIFKKKSYTKAEELTRLKRCNIRLQIEIIILFLMLLALFLFNYNYTIFKVLISCGYTDTAALENIYSDTIGERPEGAYLTNFDNAAIALFTERIREENGDEFTMLFKRGELSNEHTTMENDGNRTGFEMVNENTGLFTLTTFSSAAYENIREYTEAAAACDNLIFDLRGNPGGTLKYADKAAEIFLPEGSIIARYSYRSSLLSKTVTSDNDSPVTPKNIYILQDQNTASAAEVFINALKENLPDVTIIGETSYGKGVGQVEMRLLNGFGFKATSLEILTPEGNNINHRGITPDIETDSEAALDRALSLVGSANG